MSDRTARRTGWLQDRLASEAWTLSPLPGDASGRRYWRVRTASQTYILMDAPPEDNDLGAFLRMARRLRQVGVHAPQIHEAHREQGFLLLEDLGTQHYLDVLDETSVQRLYGDALGTLATIQACVSTRELPPYDERLLRRELGLFSEWLVDRYLGLRLSDEERALLARVQALLIENAREQPQVCVHRDFHSRNLLVSPSPSPGVLDFQDAVLGPVTYDLVSLLRDCYVAWPPQRVLEWAWGYFGLAVQSGILRSDQEAAFLRWFDLMGVQRHLKASGIFARLSLRDGKSGYLGDIPRTLGYVISVAESYPQLAALGAFLTARVLPRLSERAPDQSGSKR